MGCDFTVFTFLMFYVFYVLNIAEYRIINFSALLVFSDKLISTILFFTF